jgi:hypothetical protein
LRAAGQSIISCAAIENELSCDGGSRDDVIAIVGGDDRAGGEDPSERDGIRAGSSQERQCTEDIAAAGDIDAGSDDEIPAGGQVDRVGAAGLINAKGVTIGAYIVHAKGGIEEIGAAIAPENDGIVPQPEIDGDKPGGFSRDGLHAGDEGAEIEIALEPGVTRGKPVVFEQAIDCAELKGVASGVARESDERAVYKGRVGGRDAGLQGFRDG